MNNVGYRIHRFMWRWSANYRHGGTEGAIKATGYPPVLDQYGIAVGRVGRDGHVVLFHPDPAAEQYLRGKGLVPINPT
jgi:hypothetical protein